MAVKVWSDAAIDFSDAVGSLQFIAIADAMTSMVLGDTGAVTITGGSSSPLQLIAALGSLHDDGSVPVSIAMTDVQIEFDWSVGNGAMSGGTTSSILSDGDAADDITQAQGSSSGHFSGHSDPATYFGGIDRAALFTIGGVIWAYFAAWTGSFASHTRQLAISNFTVTVTYTDLTGPPPPIATLNVRRDPGISIQNGTNDSPAEASFRVNAPAPETGIAVAVLDPVSADPLFAGTAQIVTQAYDLQKTQLVWDVRATNWNWLLNRRRPFGTWTDVSASTIATAILTNFTSGFTWTVQPGLPNVSLTLDGSVPVASALATLAGLVPGVNVAYRDNDRHVLFGYDSGIVEVTDHFSGNGVTTTFALTHALVPTPPGGQLGRGYVTYNSVNETLSATGGGGVWTYNSTTNAITRTSAPASGTNNIEIIYSMSDGPEAITEGSAGWRHLQLLEPRITLSTDLTQVRNRVYIRGVGTTLRINATITDTSLYVQDATMFVVGGKIIIGTTVYTLIDVAPGPGLTAPSIGITPSLAASAVAGTEVRTWLQADDTAAQTALAAIEGGDGVHETVLNFAGWLISDDIATEDRAAAEAAAQADRAQAELTLFARPIETVNYATRDTKTRPGRIVSINLTDPPIVGNFKIQTVSIDQIAIDRPGELEPRFTVSASSVKFTLEDLLHRVLLTDASGASTSSASGGGGGGGGGGGPAPSLTPGATINGVLFDGTTNITVNPPTGSITDAMVNATAAIALSKLAEAVIQADGGQAFTADQSMGSHKLTSVTDPTAAQDAATKAYVDAASGAAVVKGEVPSGSINGSNAVFTTAAAYGSHLSVYLNGVRQKLTDDYSLTSATTFTMVTAPATGDVLLVDYGEGAGVGRAGALILLESHVASNSASLTFTTRNAPGMSGATFQADYDEYLITFVNVLPATNGAIPLLNLSTNGGSSYDTGTNYATAYHRWSKTGSSQAGSATAVNIELSGSLGVSNDATEQGLTGSLQFDNPLGTAGWKQLTGQTTFWYNGTPEMIGAVLACAYKSASGVNALQFTESAGNIASGTIRLYGVAK